MDRGRAPGTRLKGEIAPIIADLKEREIIRVLDLVVLKKDTDDTLAFFELSDLDASEFGGLRDEEHELAMLLSEDDVLNIAPANEPGSAAGVLAYENRSLKTPLYCQRINDSGHRP